MSLTSPITTFLRQSQLAELASPPSHHVHSPAVRHPLTRPLSADLPTHDVLYLFSNFSSYMRSPGEGADGVKSSEDFRDAVKLLDYARSLASVPQSNVHVVHLKYRFHGPSHTLRSPYASGDWQLPLNYRDTTGKIRNPVPQPFSVLNDPVVKIDYMDDGIFEPLPSQAIFSHITKTCQPPPRIIVISYIYSRVIQYVSIPDNLVHNHKSSHRNHLPALSTWALTSSPPAYIFSPLETRIREKRPLHHALGHAIPMSMYAGPADGASPNLSPRRTPASSPVRAWRHGVSRTNRFRTIDAVEPPYGPTATASHRDRKRMATSAEGTVPDLNADVSINIGPIDCATVPPIYDGVPLWSLVPGVNALHGSTASFMGLRAIDFSAINLARKASRDTGSDDVPCVVGVSSSPINVKDPGIPPPVEPTTRPSTPSKIPVGKPPSTISMTHLTPTDAQPPQDVMKRRRHSLPGPGTLSSVSAWRKGRRESMEDALDEIGADGEVGEAVCRINGLEMGVGQGRNAGGAETVEGDGEDDRQGGLMDGLLVAVSGMTRNHVDIG